MLGGIMEMELKLFGEIYRVTAATMKGRRSENQDCYSLTAASSGTLRGSGEAFREPGLLLTDRGVLRHPPREHHGGGVRT